MGAYKMLANQNQIRRSTTDITVFRGLNRSCNTGFSKISNSNNSIYTDFTDMKNMSSDNYPQLSPRKCRSRLATLNKSKIISNIISLNGGLIYLDNSGNIFYKGKYYKIDIDINSEKQIIQYGNKLIIMPEKKTFDLETHQLTNIEQINADCQCVSDEDDEYFNFHGSIEKIALNTSLSPKNKVCNYLSNLEINDVINQTINPSQTGEALNKYIWLYKDRKIGDIVEYINTSTSVLWMCTSEKDAESGIYYNDTIKKFTEISNYYLKITAPGIGKGLKQNDFIKISGLTYDILKTDDQDYTAYINDSYIKVLNNQHFKLYDVAENYIVIKADIESSIPYIGKITVSRLMPDIDTGLMIEVDNRIWGCSSSQNEVYACRQGDENNWYAYSDAIASDSYFAQIGCEGDFTGIARQNSSVIFFKENWAIKLYGNKPSNFTLNKYNVSGVEKGSEKSIIWLNGILFYKSREGIMEYSPGGQPQCISNIIFENRVYKNAVGGRHKNKYYVSLENQNSESELLVYDIEKGIWHKEDDTRMRCTTTYNDILYYVNEKTMFISSPENSDNSLLTKTAASDNGSLITGESIVIDGKEYIYGDVNLDGFVTNNDINIIQDSVNHVTTLTDIQSKIADVDGSGKVDIKDVTAIQKYVYAQQYESEDKFDWFATTGDMYDSDFNAKFISRLQIGFKPEKGTNVKIYAQYENNGIWCELTNLRFREKRAENIPVMVRRSEYLKLKICGTGYCEIFGISVTYSRGSDKKNG